MWWDGPLYLHFLDRELGQSVGLRITEHVAKSAIKCLLIGTTSRLYSGLSLVWENPAMTGSLPEFLSVLVQIRVLDLVSNHHTLDEFLATRVSLYRHDAPRYPMYFNDRERKAKGTLVPTSYKPTSATLELARELGAWSAAGGGPNQATIDQHLLAAVRQSVSATLSRREEQAVTFPLFAPQLSGIGAATIAQAEGILRRRISSGYLRHYVDFAVADIPTGVEGLDYFDECARSFPLFDARLLSLLLQSAGLSELLEGPWKANEIFWARTGEWRGSATHGRLRSEVTVLLSALFKTVTEASRGWANSPSLYATRNAMFAMLRTAIAPVAETRFPIDSHIERAVALVRTVVEILRRDRSFSRNMEIVLAERKDNACDVLIVVATDVERDAVLRRAQEITGGTYQTIFGNRRTYFDIGHIGPSRVLLVQTEMGSVSPGASLSTVQCAIGDLKPSHILLVGIAFGVDPDKQKIGEILVSRQLQAYELQRVGTGPEGTAKITLRGDKATASTKILGRLRAATANWDGSHVEFGLVISGEKLVDNLDFRNQLIKLIPEAIGGEMEGAGLYAASTEQHADWILVKAISDWADGKKRSRKRERQTTAAGQAANFALHALAQGGFGTTPQDGAVLIY